MHTIMYIIHVPIVLVYDACSVLYRSYLCTYVSVTSCQWSPWYNCIMVIIGLLIPKRIVILISTGKADSIQPAMVK